jgi:hypothetical protein
MFLEVVFSLEALASAYVVNNQPLVAGRASKDIPRVMILQYRCHAGAASVAVFGPYKRLAVGVLYKLLRQVCEMEFTILFSNSMLSSRGQ